MAQHIRVFLCSGKPNSGKTTWTHYYREQNENVQRYCLDTFFRNKAYEKVAGFVKDIFVHCHRGWHKQLYLDVSKRLLGEGLKDVHGVVDVVIEGFVLKYIEKELSDILKEFGCDEIIVLNFGKTPSQFSFYYLDQLINFEKEPDGSIGDACRKSVQKMKITAFNRIKNGINYQSFTEFNHRGDSRSDQKLKLANINLKNGQSFLDIGCNNGFFCFKMAEQTSGKILGLDVNKKVIDIANTLNHQIFRKPNIDFRPENIFNFNSNGEKFDIIFCASTFHYFGDSQSEFFKIINALLSDTGTAIIEIETYNKGVVPEKNKGNRKLNYPNRAWIDQETKHLFDIVNVASSSQQAGSDFPRLFYYMTKK